MARAEPTVPITCVTPLFALVATCPRRQRLHKHSSVDGLPLFLWMVCRQPRVSAVRLRSVRLRRREAQPRTGAARRGRAQEAGRQKGAQTLLPCRGAGHTGGSCCESVTQAGSRKVHRSCTTDARGAKGARLLRSVADQRMQYFGDRFIAQLRKRFLSRTNSVNLRRIASCPLHINPKCLNFTHSLTIHPSYK